MQMYRMSDDARKAASSMSLDNYSRFPKTISDVGDPPIRPDSRPVPRRPSDPSACPRRAQYGMMVKEGRPELLPRERRHGEQLVWQTSAMAANAQVFGDKALGGWGLPEQK